MTRRSVGLLCLLLGLCLLAGCGPAAQDPGAESASQTGSVSEAAVSDESIPEESASDVSTPDDTSASTEDGAADESTQEEGPKYKVVMQWEQPDTAYRVGSGAPDWVLRYGDLPKQTKLPASGVSGPLYLYRGYLDETYHYGVCTASGELLTAPVYTVLGYYGVGKQAWLLFDSTRERERVREAGWLISPYTTPCTLLAQDGSFALEFDDVARFYDKNSYDSYVDVGYLAVCKGGLWGGVDYYGETVIPFTRANADEVYAQTRARFDSVVDRVKAEADGYASCTFFSADRYWDGDALYDLDGNIIMDEKQLDYFYPWLYRGAFGYIADIEEGEGLLLYDLNGTMKRFSSLDGVIELYSSDDRRKHTNVSTEGNYIKLSNDGNEIGERCTVLLDLELNQVCGWTTRVDDPLRYADFMYGAIYREVDGVYYTYRPDGAVLAAVEPLPTGADGYNSEYGSG